MSKKTLHPHANKFHVGNSIDGKHFWLTPPDLYDQLDREFKFTFDPCPYPKPDDFDGLTCEWGGSNWVNPPFGSIIHEGKKKGPTAWARKAIAENLKGKSVVLVYPIDKWVLMLLAAGAKVRNLGDVRWNATETDPPAKARGVTSHALYWRPNDHSPNATRRGHGRSSLHKPNPAELGARSDLLPLLPSVRWARAHAHRQPLLLEMRVRGKCDLRTDAELAALAATGGEG